MRRVFSFFAAFLLSAAVLIIGLLGAARIPRDAIHNQIKESAEYFAQYPQNFRHIVEGVDGSLRDQYADVNLLDIAYYIDSEHPVESIVWDYYYVSYSEDEYVMSLAEVVKTDPPANMEYLRYWHGSLMIIRPLLAILNIEQIYIFNSIVLLALLALLVVLLVKNGFKTEAVCFLTAMAAVNIWFVPSCLEFTWMFLVMIAASIVTVSLSVKGRYESLGFLFLVTGIVAAFFDFLTTETLTMLIPLLLLIRIRGRIREDRGFIIKNFLLWACGFVFMWLLKWVLASVYLKMSVFPYIRDNALFQLGLSDNQAAYLLALEGVLRNLRTLAPFGYGRIGGIIFLAGVLLIIVIPVLKNRLMIRGIINISRIRVYLLLGLVPFARYLALPFHTWHHYFFMYRALASSVMALCFILLELVEIVPQEARS